MKIFEYISQLIIPVFILVILVYAFARKTKVYDSFISGAKEGPAVILRIFPYLLAIFVAIKTFQASGAFDATKSLFAGICAYFGVPLEVISIALIKPLSGSASLGIFTDMVKTLGPDSLAVIMGAVIMGSAETTFYVLAVYLGAVGIKNSRYLVPVCLISDAIGIVLAISIVKLLF